MKKIETMNLYFEDRHGQWHLIGKDVSEDEVYQRIKAHVKHLNPNFHIYYIRSWKNDDGLGTTYDVGSHVEFFHTRIVEHASTIIEAEGKDDG